MQLFHNADEVFQGRKINREGMRQGGITDGAGERVAKKKAPGDTFVQQSSRNNDIVQQQILIQAEATTELPFDKAGLGTV